MSKPVFLNSKVVYHDNSKEYHIDARGKDLASVLRAIDAEEITTAEPSSSVASECHSDNQHHSPTIPPDFFHVSERFSEENIRERLAAELSQATTKKDYCRGLYRLQRIGCINIDQYASDAQRAVVFNRFQSKYDLSASDFCKARMN